VVITIMGRIGRRLNQHLPQDAVRPKFRFRPQLIR